MKVVSSQSEAEIAKNRAAELLKYELRNFAANFLRVVRGAGRAYEILPQMNNCIALAHKYFEAWGQFPDAWTIEQWLDPGKGPNDTRELKTNLEYVEDAVSRAALQIIASTFAGQRTQYQTARNDLVGAIHNHGRLTDAKRRELQGNAKPTRKRGRKEPTL